MSNYLHVFPASSPELRDFALQQGISFKDLPHSRLPTQPEFDKVVQQVDRYDYTLDSETGLYSLRINTAPVKDLFTIIRGVAELCGPQLALNESTMALFIVKPETLFDEFENSVLF